jgi:plasmid stabilization system protein ParE
MTYRVLALRKAQVDLHRILSWLVERSPQGAEHWYDAYWAALDDLRKQPLSLGLAADCTDLPFTIREKLFKTPHGLRYRILFVVVGPDVRILRIRGPGQRTVKPDDLI